ncbi:hypothetical protein JWJ90_13630 [Desulfobulbus rhabdoformis]|uniref:hypothetical protein n=1 Tax=Desulfobulbus rhabdoformis TaxID=34032 RepID=UPI0019624C6A|nr:hypothetical protein [Desulfobulbus rhabdoformis]MBM9615320.1 hypothetical protein [Desulfobulbus rhabdoformis]
MAGGSRPGAGRKKGSGNKVVPDEYDPETQEALSPLEYMLRVMNNPKVDPGRRDRMAVASAPFVHERADKGGKKKSVQEAAEEESQGGDFRPMAKPGSAVH